MSIDYLILLAVAIVLAAAFCLLGYVNDYIKNGSKFDLAEFLATIAYSVVLGYLAVSMGLISLDTLSNWQAIFTTEYAANASIYIGLLYGFRKIVSAVVSQFTSKTTLFARKTGINPKRLMDDESRSWLVKDQSNEFIKKAVLDAVDAAQGFEWVQPPTPPDTPTCHPPVPAPVWTQTHDPVMRYAIAAGAWIYLVEFGEVFGAKHYFFKGYFGSNTVAWKPCTSACFEQIRSTGKFPDYEVLY